MAVLVWAIESVLMGVWATVLAGVFSTPFHSFMAISHLSISGITAVLQLLIVSRNPARAFAVSQAFVCAVAALALVYLSVLLTPSLHATAFGSPSVGILPLGGCVGLAWCLASMLSATGMALGDNAQKSTLFLHPFGYHLPVMLPCVFIAMEKKLLVLAVVELIVWGAYVALHFFAASVASGPTAPGGFFSCCSGMTGPQIFSFVLKGIARIACLLVPVVTWFVGPPVLAVTTLVIAAMNFFSWASVLDWVLGDYTTTQLSSVSVQPQTVVPMTITTPLRWRDKMI
jgi:hypothetical protein